MITKKILSTVTTCYCSENQINSNKKQEINSINSTFQFYFIQKIKFNWMICLLLIITILLTAFGNILVCIAVFRERKLQTRTNFFLISLAIADCMVAIFVMPTSLLVEILNYYPFSTTLCTIWICFDVLCCTSSIHHMSTMALDRYLTIKFPLKYGRSKSKNITLIKIIFVWFISFLICLPILIFGFIDSTNVFDTSKRVCQLFNKKFRIYGSIFAFYIPFIIMVIAYISTIRILKKILDKKVDDKKQIIEENLRNFQKKTFTNILEGLFLQTSLQLDLESYNNNNINFNNSNNIGKNSFIYSRSYPQLKLNIQPSTQNTQTNQLNRSRYSFANYQSIKNVAQNEKKALKVLIIIFCVFVTLWCPFFLLNTASALCENCVKQFLSKYESIVYSVLTWLGYFSSMANPIVYTMFNKAFRTAFINVLKCKNVSIEQPTRMMFKQPTVQAMLHNTYKESPDGKQTIYLNDLDGIEILNKNRINKKKYYLKNTNNCIIKRHKV